MATSVEYIKNGRRRYPDFEITEDIQKQMIAYHEKLKKEGYEIKACNIAVKDNKFFWILYDKGNICLEQYGIIPAVKEG